MGAEALSWDEFYLRCRGYSLSNSAPRKDSRAVLVIGAKTPDVSFRSHRIQRRDVPAEVSA